MSFNRSKTETVRKDAVTGKDVIVWAVEYNGEVVGEAVPVYKTATQRTWDIKITVDGVSVTLEGQKSVADAYKALEAELAKARKAVKAPKAPKAPATPVATPADEVVA
jgi:hypothetical protein